MKTKTFPAAIKAGPGLIEGEAEAGEFEAIVSVFDNIDRAGDIVRAGAFADTIAAWAKSGDTLPVLWSHKMDDPMCNIGAVTQIEELGPGDPRVPETNAWVKAHGGLYIKALLDTGAEASAVARQVRHLLMKRRVTQFSFAYEEMATRPGEEEGVTELLKLWIYEVGPTPVGANGFTQLIGAKAQEPDPPPPDEPEQAPQQDEIQERGPSASLLRIRCDIAALAAEHDIDD